MKIIPSDYLEFKTDLSYDEVNKMLNKNIQPRKILFSPFGKKDKIPFEGTLVENQFNIQRNINYRNGFLPQIIGTFEDELGKTKITAELKLLSLVYYFVIVFIGFALLKLIMALYLYTSSDLELILIPIGFIIFIVLLANVGFMYERKKSIEKLKELLEYRN